jgi:hypothetical protein
LVSADGSIGKVQLALYYVFDDSTVTLLAIANV